jgi:glycosyltransferase A (GT-A) superfamily protein (DUF2064 family)/SAM-dependent methyltransferase
MSIDVDVVLPCLDGAAALPGVLAAIPPGFRAIVVDNGSTEGSPRVAVAHGAYVVHQPRRGYGAAVHTGLEPATADVVWVLDADGSLDPAVLPGVVAPIHAGEAELAVGRRVPVGAGAWPWHARAGSAVLAAVRAAVAYPFTTSRRCGPHRGRRFWTWAWRTVPSATRWNCCCGPAGPAGGSPSCPWRTGHVPPAPHPRSPARYAARCGPSATWQGCCGDRHPAGGGQGSGGRAGQDAVVSAGHAAPGGCGGRGGAAGHARRGPGQVRATPSAAPVLAYTGVMAEAERAEQIRAALAGWRLVRQRGEGFGERLAHAHIDAAALLPQWPVLQIGMDTPQVTPRLLEASLRRLAAADAVLGPAADGGWWALGLRDPRHAAVLRDVPMSTPDNGRLTRLALAARGLRIAELPTLSDVDTWDTATAVAAATPNSRFVAAAADVRGGFDPAYAGAPGPHWLVHGDGRRTPLPVRRWHSTPEPAAHAVLDRCAGPTVDVGCGPGRLTAALAGRGIPALGIDISTRAIDLTRRRGGAAIHRDVFAPLPGEGRWSHVLLMDGNIGIGGHPDALLRRCSELLRPGGTILVEVDGPDAGLWRGHAHLAYGHDERPPHSGSPFRWARLGIAAVDRAATDAGLTTRAAFQRERRWFAELERP